MLWKFGWNRCGDFECRYFFDDSRQICEKKTQLMNEVKYMDDHRYIKAYGFSTKNTKWENLEIEENVYE